jgi:hypothetical protein
VDLSVGGWSGVHSMTGLLSVAGYLHTDSAKRILSGEHRMSELDLLINTFRDIETKRREHLAISYEEGWRILDLIQTHAALLAVVCRHAKEDQDSR